LKRKTKPKSNIFKRKVTIYKWQLNLFGTIALLIGTVVGFYLTLSNVVMPIFAETQTTVVKQTDTDFSQGTLSDVEILGSGNGAVVQLESGSGAAGDAWFDTDFQFRKKITINNADQSEDLLNFPILVKLDSGSDIDYSKTKDSGEDVRFTDSNGTTQLDHEIETWNESGSSYVWVRVPQVDGSSGADYIYIYYGNASASDDQNAEDVWNSGYEMVQHLKDATTSTVIDSTSSSYSGSKRTSNAPQEIDGKLGKAQDFGAADYISLGDILNPGSNDWTVEIWFKREVTGRTNANILYNKENLWETAAGGGYATYAWRPHWAWDGGSSSSLSTGTWYKNTIVYNHVTQKMYKDDTEVYSRSQTGDIGTNTQLLQIGARGNTGHSSFFYGQIDEMRVSSVARSADWISASYKSENDSFVSYGSEQTSLPGSGSYESPTDSNVIDLIWNGGWGDGTAGSTAFSATVANVGANAQVTFQMRSADTAGNLTSATYQTLGIANSGTTFSRTKTQLDALAIDIGSDGRFVQVKATLTSSDGITNPNLDDFTIYYMYDDTAPEVNASSISMKKIAGGSTVPQGGWTNSLSPYFSWTGGSDSQSGLKGYCLYLGTDENGNPATAKGLLGTSPVDTTGTTCQFIINATSIDFATAAYRGSPFLTSSSGLYYFNIKAIDSHNNVFTGSAATNNFKFDNTVPTNPSYISLPGDWISTKAVTAYWPSSGGDGPSDSHSGLLGMQYRVGSSGIWYGDNHNEAEDTTDLLDHIAGSYTTVEDPDYTDLEEGSNTMYFRTWDAAGNVSTEYVTGVIKLNTVAPSVPRNLEVTPNDNTSNSYAFDWDAPTSYTGVVDNIVYCYTVNTLPSTITCNFTAAGETELTADAFATQPGANTIYVVAKDEANNVNYEIYASVEFTYSGTAPGIPQNTDIADVSVKATSSWKLALSWEEPASTGAGVEDYEIYHSTDGTTYSLESTVTGISYVDTGLSQATHYYKVKACDSANNCGAYSSAVSLYPDGKFTESAELTGGPSDSSVTTKRATISWSTDRTCDSKVTYGKKSGDYYDEEPSNSTHTTDHEIKLTSLDPGEKYYYRAKWTDEDGNTGQSSEKTFTTDDAPTVQEVQASTVGIDYAVLKFTTEGASSAKVYYGKSTDFGGTKELSTSTSEAEYSVELSGLEDGTKYYYKINTFDAEEDEYEGDINSFETLPRPKVSSVRIQQVKGTAQPTVLVSWETNTEVSSIITYGPEGGEARDEVNVELIKGTHKMILRGLAAHTRYNLTVKGNDKAGNEAISDTHSFTTATDTRPPLISSLSVEGSNTKGADGSDEQGSQLVVTWNTDEPASSQVEFGEGAGATYSQKTQEDSKLTYNHLVVVSGLTASKVYHLRAVSRDEIGNQTDSIDTVTITPKASDNALDLVIMNLREVFGFLN